MSVLYLQVNLVERLISLVYEYDYDMIPVESFSSLVASLLQLYNLFILNASV